MDLRALHVTFDPCDLGLKRLDPLFEFFDGHRIEVLARERDQRIVGFAREEIFEIHAPNVDPRAASVNKPLRRAQLDPFGDESGDRSADGQQ